MPHRCFIPGCRGNYDNGPHVSVFSFPTDEKIRKQWIQAIPRQNQNITKASKMGNRISTTSEPVIMTEAFLEAKIIQNIVSAEDLDDSEFQKLIKIDGLENDLVFSLDLEHQNLVNIDELWRYKYLTKLELPNNYLEKIEGVDSLITLQYLDLSFNFIKCICNLENLINLTTLCLTSNEIVVLENMESLKKLETFLIRDNKIKCFDNVYYLKQFHNLSHLAIDRNPIIQETDVKLHIIAVLPQLRYLNFIRVTSDQIQLAFCKFPFEKDKSLFTEQVTEDKFTCGYSHSDKEAYVEGLVNGQGFQSFLSSDKNYELLCSFPLATEIFQEFSSKITSLFDKWHELGHEFYEKIQHEKSQFLQMVTKAEKFSTDVFRKEELKFLDFKENIPKELCDIYQNASVDDEKVKKIAELKEIYNDSLQKTFRNFMNSSCLYIDLVTNMCQTYEKEVHVINIKYVEEVSKFSSDIMNLNKTFSEKLQQLYIDIRNSGLNPSEYLDTSDNEQSADNVALLQLIKEKDLIKIALELSIRIHSTLLKERINHLKISLNRNLEETIDQVYEEAFVKQSEFARNTLIFYNKQKYLVDKLFSKNNIFENYFNYHQKLH